MADDIKLVRVDHDIIVVSLVEPRGFRVWQVGAGGRPWLGGPSGRVSRGSRTGSAL